MTGRYARGTAALLPVILIGAGAAAAPTTEVLVTGTRLPVDESTFPGSSTVIHRAELLARNEANVLEVLRDLEGVQVAQPGPGGVPQLFIRGGEPNFTVFLIDGVRVNDLNNTRGGSFDLASVNTRDVERIEIVRGPQSSIYGSDGLSGVVNIITRAGSGAPALEVEGEGGGDDYRRGHVALSGGLGTGGFVVQAGHRDDGEPVEGSRYETSTLGGRLRLSPSSRTDLQLHARFADSEATSFPQDSGGPRRAVLRDLEERSARDLSLGGSVEWRPAGRWSLETAAAWYGRRDRSDSPAIAPGVRDAVPANGYANDLERQQVSLRATNSRAASRLTAGVDYQREEGDSRGYVELGPDFRLPTSYALDRDIVGLFAEGRLEATQRLTLQGSLRRDEPEDETGRTTWKLGALHLSEDGLTSWRLNAGTGFKLPSFFALGNPLVGNPDLRPERSRSLDLGVTRGTADGRAEAGLTLFAARYKDLVDFDPDSFTSVNRSKVKSRGAEVHARAALVGALELRAHATYIDLEVEDADRRLLQRPEWRAGAGARWSPAERWTVDLSWLYNGSAWDSSVPTGELRLADWHRVDLNLHWQANARLGLGLAVDNLLDGRWEEAIGFPAAGIRARLLARYRFGG